jgi:hypothetical protein
MTRGTPGVTRGTLGVTRGTPGVTYLGVGEDHAEAGGAGHHLVVG